MNEIIFKPKGVRKKAVHNIKKEHLLFKYNMLSSYNRIIYDNCNKIHFYECLFEYFMYNDNPITEFINYAAYNEDVLATLFEYYLNNESCNVDTWEAIEDMWNTYSYTSKIK